MAITNHERVGKSLEYLKEGLTPFVEREFKNIYKSQALARARLLVNEDRNTEGKTINDWDVALLLKLMW